MMTHHLEKAPVELTLFAGEHGVHRRSHVVVDAALADTLEKTQTPSRAQFD